MNYHTLYKLSRYLNNDKCNKMISINKDSQRYKNTYLYKPLPLGRIHYTHVKNYVNKNYKLKVYGIETLEELNEVMKYNVNIIEIVFHGKFNTFVDKNNLPKALKSIVFGADFNQNVDNLPKNLQHIDFGFSFNQTVDNLPQTLKFISFAYRFNQPVDNLPKNLQYIKFGSQFNKNVDKLPSKLKSIKFGHNFNKNVNNLPKNL